MVSNFDIVVTVSTDIVFHALSISDRDYCDPSDPLYQQVAASYAAEAGVSTSQVSIACIAASLMLRVQVSFEC